MGARKRLAADKRKEKMKTTYISRLVDYPTSPRKMRLVADIIRGVEANKALDILTFTRKEAAKVMAKVLRSAIANFEEKSGLRAEESDLYIKEVFVDESKPLKRVQPAPQGRAHRIKKRSNHVTLILDTKSPIAQEQTETVDLSEAKA
jgi:large subunit ribosomal protein L22